MADSIQKYNGIDISAQNNNIVSKRVISLVPYLKLIRKVIN